MGRSKQIEVIISDLENNPRRWLQGLIKEYKADDLDLIRVIMEDLEIEDRFDNYLIIEPDGSEIEYTYGGHSAACPLEPPKETGKELEAKVCQTLSESLQNPRTSYSIGKPIKFRTTIYPSNTLVLVDQRFEKAALQAISKDGFEPCVYQDRMKPTLLDKILNLL